MKGILAFLATAGMLVAGYGAWAEDYAIAALGLVCSLGCAVVLALDIARRQRQGDPFGSLGNEARALLRPIRKLHGELEAFAQGPGSEAVRIVAAEALDEAAGITRQAIKMVSLRKKIKSAIAGGAADAGMKASMDQIDASLGQAEAVLSELKAKLVASSIAPGAADSEAADIRESTNRLRALSVSIDEAEQLLEEHPG